VAIVDGEVGASLAVLGSEADSRSPPQGPHET
jgi:hypothetical protein